MQINSIATHQCILLCITEFTSSGFLKPLKLLQKMSLAKIDTGNKTMEFEIKSSKFFTLNSSLETPSERLSQQ